MGTRNGVAFDDTSLTPENWSTSLSLAGEPGPVAIADGLVDAFPLRMMALPYQLVFADQPVPQWPQWYPTTVVPGLPGVLQNLYNQQVIQIGEKGKEKGAKEVVLKPRLMEAIQQNNPNGVWPKSYGLYTLDTGVRFAQGIGEDKKLSAAQGERLNQLARIWNNPKVASTAVEIAYIVDGGTQNPRSGNLIVNYRYITTYTGTKNGQPVSETHPQLSGGLLLHDASSKR